MQLLRAQFESVLLVMNPKTLGGQPFASGHRRERSDNGHQVAPAFGLDLQYRKTTFLTEESDAFNQTGDRFNGFSPRSFDTNVLLTKPSWNGKDEQWMLLLKSHDQ